MPEPRDMNAKALRINLDPLPYGTFAEIGGGQEVSRWFFHVGGAAGTVAETVSAYDKAVSDALYGRANRYVSRERLMEMLDHEYSSLLERLGDVRGKKTTFFVFADTVATLSHEGNNECHGWLGVRFQHAPGSPTSDIVLHVSLRDKTAARQQQALGILGVNLLYAAVYQRSSPHELLAGLMDGLSISDVEVDVVEGAGPALKGFEDARALAVGVLSQGLTNAVMFDEHGRMDQASSVIHKRALLLHRSSITRENPELDAMLAAGAAMLNSEVPGMEHPPLPVLELSLESVLGNEPRDQAKAADRIGDMISPGHAAMVTRWAENYELSNYLGRYSSEPLRFVLGLDMVVQMLRHHFYHRIDGGLLEGLGRLLAPNVRVYAFSMPAAVLRRRLELYDTDTTMVRFPDRSEVSLEDLELAPPVRRLLQYLRETGWIIPARSGNRPEHGYARG